MKKFFKILLYIIGIIILAIGATYLFYYIKWNMASSENLALLGKEAPVLTIDGYQF